MSEFHGLHFSVVVCVCFRHLRVFPYYFMYLSLFICISLILYAFIVIHMYFRIIICMYHHLHAFVHHYIYLS